MTDTFAEVAQSLQGTAESRQKTFHGLHSEVQRTRELDLSAGQPSLSPTVSSLWTAFPSSPFRPPLGQEQTASKFFVSAFLFFKI